MSKGLESRELLSVCNKSRVVECEPPPQPSSPTTEILLCFSSFIPHVFLTNPKSQPFLPPLLSSCSGTRTGACTGTCPLQQCPESQTFLDLLSKGETSASYTPLNICFLLNDSWLIRYIQAVNFIKAVNFY